MSDSISRVSREREAVGSVQKRGKRLSRVRKTEHKELDRIGGLLFPPFFINTTKIRNELADLKRGHKDGLT